MLFGAHAWILTQLLVLVGEASRRADTGGQA